MNQASATNRVPERPQHEFYRTRPLAAKPADRNHGLAPARFDRLLTAKDRPGPSSLFRHADLFQPEPLAFRSRLGFNEGRALRSVPPGIETGDTGEIAVVYRGEPRMRQRLLPVVYFLALGAAGPGTADEGASPTLPVVVTSPHGRIKADVLLEKSDRAASIPHYRVWFQDRPVALPSRLGIDLGDGTNLGADSTIEAVKTRSFRETYIQFPGKRSRVENHGSETTITLRERAAPARRWEVVVRAYDDGVAFRYRFPAQEGWARLIIGGERTAFRLPENAVAYALPLSSFTTSHEARYQKRLVAEIPSEWLLGLPLLVELPGTGWAALTEASLTGYAGLYLARQGRKSASLLSRLSPLPDEPKVAVQAGLPHESPWRVLMIADKLERLVESDLVLNLNAPCAIADTSWIKPGKTTFPWWNGFYERDVPFKPGLNTRTAKYYIDFCAKREFPITRSTASITWRGTAVQSSPTRAPALPRASTALTCPRSFATPGPGESGFGSGCTGRPPRSTWRGPSRSTASGASRASCSTSWTAI